MTKEKKKKKFRLHRLFSRRKGPKSSSPDTNNGDDVKQDASAAKTSYKWSPEEIMDEMNGVPVTVEMPKTVLLMEVGGVDRGWKLDLSGSGEEPGLVVISRYDVPIRTKAPSGPPSNLKSLPWSWFKDRKIFNKLETGKLSEMSAFVTGKVKSSGSYSAWDGLTEVWNEAKERITERKKNLNLGYGSTGDDMEDDPEDEEEEEEEEVDEEALIIATYKPEIEPKNPLKKDFWKRHFGTDALVSSYLYLIASIFYMFMAFNILKVQLIYVIVNRPFQNEVDAIDASSKIAHGFANAIASILYALASVYFIKLSYPETGMLMAYRAMAVDPNSMGFVERYFTANEMLIALWMFLVAMALPMIGVVIYELFWLHAYFLSFKDFIAAIVGIPLVGVMNVAAMPDNLRLNNGQGSSYLFDGVLVPMLSRYKKSSSENEMKLSKKFWSRHLGSDFLAGSWIFAIVGVLGGLGATFLVFVHPLSYSDWMIFGSVMPFSIGSLLMIRSVYPDTMNTSIFCSSSDDDTNDETSDEVSSDETPLIS